MKIIIEGFVRKRTLRQSLDNLCHQLLEAADVIDGLVLENQALRLRGERLAESIESNDWTANSAIRMADCLASWREFESRQGTVDENE